MKLYAISVMGTKNDGKEFRAVHFVHITEAVSEEEAIGIAYKEGEKEFGGHDWRMTFSVALAEITNK